MKKTIRQILTALAVMCCFQVLAGDYCMMHTQDLKQAKSSSQKAIEAVRVDYYCNGESKVIADKYVKALQALAKKNNKAAQVDLAGHYREGLLWWRSSITSHRISSPNTSLKKSDIVVPINEKLAKYWEDAAVKK